MPEQPSNTLRATMLRGDDLNLLDGARRVRLLAATVALLLLGNIVGLLISVLAGWPAEFGAVGDQDNVLGEFFRRGTLLAAPPAPLLALVVSALLAFGRKRWLSVLGLLGLIVVAALFIVGTLGEPLRPQASDPPVAFLFAWQAGFIVVSVALITLAAVDILRRFRGE